MSIQCGSLWGTHNDQAEILKNLHLGSPHANKFASLLLIPGPCQCALIDLSITNSKDKIVHSSD